jgi:serine/tyrosine/threonine adenylyltransferase
MVNVDAIVTDHGPMGWRFDNTYSRLPDVFFAPAKPATVGAPRLVILNRRLAADLGLDLDTISPEAAASLFAGQDRPTDRAGVCRASVR